jgi:hypothetical protein
MAIPAAARLAAARLLGLRVRIQPAAWMSFSCDCCVLSGRGLCVGLILTQRGLTEGGMSNEGDLEAPSGEVMTGNWDEMPLGGGGPTKCTCNQLAHKCFGSSGPPSRRANFKRKYVNNSSVFYQ